MARKKQTFDPHALTREVVSATHEVVTVPFRLRTYRVIRKILIIFIAVSIVNVVFANVFYTPKMYRILRENSELVFKYRLLQDKIRAEQRKLDEIHHRDNFVYRALFSADTLNIGGIYTPYPASKYAALAGDEYAAEVRAREQFYLQRGINSVPAVIINDKHLISGGQPVEVFEQALRQIAAQS